MPESEKHTGRAASPQPPPATDAPAYRLFDERGRPDFRDVFGALAAQATGIWTAVRQVRLSTLDLRKEELTGVSEFRVLVSELNTQHLEAEARSLQVAPQRSANLALWLNMLDEGQLAVRAAPLAGWSPDFSVFSGADGPHTVLLGTHWFGRPYPKVGPALGALHTGDAAALAARRHAELWARAHDVDPAVRGILEASGPGR